MVRDARYFHLGHLKGVRPKGLEEIGAYGTSIFLLVPSVGLPHTIPLTMDYRRYGFNGVHANDPSPGLGDPIVHGA